MYNKYIWKYLNIFSLENENNYIDDFENISFNEENKKEKDINCFLTPYLTASLNIKEHK